ncbi:autophagy-related protein 2 homolog B isoform X2 [Candoia aspera]|uniref:autophagy-related protein 2 homolog B isoform X2 n=1 Tax=Candoia aspera TaxID=51853 RepID=UPI002FD7BDF8
MPWPFSESIKKRACRYLLQRYLGHFLQEKLSLEQLTLDLYQGTGCLAQVPLDKWSLNEILESADAPLEVTEGFIQSISLSIPWGSLLQDNCALEVKGLEMVFKPRPCLASSSEPMYWSSFMTSSMQLAKECLSQKLTDEQGEGSQPFEGLEKFAETIETVLRRVKINFLDTVLRIEHVPDNSKSGTALEIHIEKTVYCDETADECSGNVHQPTAFAHKLLQLSGVSFFWDEFPASVKSSPVCSTTQLLTEPKLSPSWNPKITYEPHPQLARNLPEVSPSDPVQICKLIGRMELSLTLKQNEVLPGAKLDVDGQIDSIHLFLSPRQVHLLLDMFAAIAKPENPSRIELSNKDRKNRPMQQEDEYQIQMELNRYLRKETLPVGTQPDLSFYEAEAARTPSSREEEVFFSMADMEMSHSLSSLPPLGDPPTMDLDLSLTSTYTATPAGSPLGAAVQQSTWGEFDQNKQELPQLRSASFTPNIDHSAPLRRTSLPSRSISVDESKPELLFRLVVGAFSMSVLHIDPLPPPETSLNISPLTSMAQDFFTRIEKVDPAQIPTEDFLFLRKVFAKACSHDHLRLIGTGLKVSYEQRQRSASQCLNADLSIGQLELLECLFSTDSHSQIPHYTELLRFNSEKQENKLLSPSCLQLHYKHLDNKGPQGSQGRLSSVPQKADLQLKLSPVFCELDISIVDRLNSLLQPQKLTTVETMASHMYTSYNKHISLHKAFAEVFLDDSRAPTNCKVSIQVTAPALKLSVRFPIPDLRADPERGPWFKKSLQKEILQLEFSDTELKTEFIGGPTSEQIQIELTFKELIGSFEENKDKSAIQFFKVSSGVLGEMISSDNFDWPRIVLKINPLAIHSILERMAPEEEEEVDAHFHEEEEGGCHSLKDVCDIRRPEPSPFSSRRVMFENEEMVMPGDAVEMTEFQDKAISNSHYVLELMLPNVYLTLPNKSFYEKLYNRISNDLLLWEPTAPSPVETFENISYGVGISVASQLINTFSKDSFSQFKSTIHYDDESGSEEETLQYFSTVDSNYCSRRRKKNELQNRSTQNFLSLLLNINHGLLSIFTDIKQDDGSVFEDKHGEFWFEFCSGSLFCVTKYEGFEDKHYICLHSNSLNLYHQGVVEETVSLSEIKLPSTTHPHWLEPTIYFSEEEGLNTAFSDDVGADCLSMLSVAVKIQSNKSETKEFLVAVGLKGATLQHRVLPSGLSWHEQILYFLNISDEPVLGYNPPASITTFHVHLWSCALNYKPLFLPTRSLLTVETFSISSSMALDKSSSTLRIILDEAALHLSEKSNATVNLQKDYVQVMDMGLLELTIRTVKSESGEERSNPYFELHCSSDVIHIRTCSDSCAALMNLIQYIASYGDLNPPAKMECTSGVTKQNVKADVSSWPSSQGPVLAEADQKILRDLMSDAMEEIETQQFISPSNLRANGSTDEKSRTPAPTCSDLFLFPDESGNLSQAPSPTCASFTPNMINEVIGDAPSENDDFCILFAPKAVISDKEEEPVVKTMVEDAIIIKENHFSLPMKKTDTSKTPLRFPVPLMRYVVKEISLIWHLYGGKDFGNVTPTSPAKSYISPQSSPSPSHTPTRHGRNTACGGKGRNPDFLIEIQLSKVKFQHEVYPTGESEGELSILEQPVSRQIFMVQDLEIRDRLATSQMNKFLYLYCSKEMPRKAHSNMLTVKALHVRPESGRSPQECCLRVSLMPLRLNIDQDALFFLKDFFTSLSTEVEVLMTPDPEVKKPPGPEVTCILPRHQSGFREPNPVISFSLHKQSSQNGSVDSVDMLNGDDHNLSHEEASFSDQPIFFREFRFTSEVPIRLDYHGKHVSMDQGTLAGILIGLAQLNCSELKLKRLCYRHGLLGVDKLFSYAVSEWLNDIRKNQLPGILGGVGPIHSLIQLVQGLKDLVWLPIEQYRKDGRIVRGFQRGAASFGTSTAMAALELTNRMVQTIQAAAETAYDMVSPGPSLIETKKIKRLSRCRLAYQPVDLREGVAKAYSVVKEGITDTAHTIYETATREHENRGVTGAVGGVLRQIPPTVVKPLIVATEATSNVLGGMRNQIRPDVRQEESQKWRLEED